MVVTRRALNRALLARQLLLARADLPVYDTVAHLFGMQAQAPNPPYLGLWTRLAGFRPDDLSELITARRVVRISVLRCTIHLVTADDALTLRPLTQPVHDRVLLNSTYGPAIRGLDRDALCAAARDLLAERPLTGKELGALLQRRWPDRDGASLAYVVRCLLPLVQVPPRGLWGRSGRSAHTTAEAWLGRPLDPAPSPAAMVLRYLAGYGPASVRDVQAWSGLTRLGPVVEALRGDLTVLRDENGTELFDLPDAPRPAADTPAPVRLLPEFDQLLLAHADRTRVISDEYRRRIFTVNGIVRGTVLVDGEVHGAWKLNRAKAAATVDVEAFAPLPAAARAAVQAEAAALLEFAAPGAERPEVRVAAPA